MTASQQFRGFAPGSLDIFQRLFLDNTRENFLALKPDYERSLKAPAMALVADLDAAFRAADLALRGDPKRALFRPNRDIRFSRDKSPYKTNISFVMSRSGEKQDPGLFYFQFGLDGLFAAAGFYQLEPAQLVAFRHRILAKPDEWRALCASLAKRGSSLEGGAIGKRLPRDVPAEIAADLSEYMLYKSYITRLELSEAEMAQPALVDRLVAFARDATKLLEFGWMALAP